MDKQDERMSKYMELFDNVISKYDGILQKFDHTESMLNEYITQSEESGYIVSTKYYEKLRENELKNIRQLEAERERLIKARDEWVANGGEVGSEDWNTMCEQIDAVTQSIEQGETAIISYSNAIREIEWQVFDLMQDMISNISKEADFLIELMSNDKLYDDNGQLTDEGMATMGLHGQNYNTYMSQADNYASEIAEIEALLAKDPYNQDLLARRQELIDKQQESILAAEAEKQAIIDMVKEGIELELSALEEKINLYQESLDSQKD